MKKIITLLLFISFTTVLFSQESWNEKMGDRYFDSYSFKEAITKYEFVKDKSTDVNRKLAEAYFYTANYEKSEEYYAIVVAANEHKDLDLYKYASVLAINKKYAKADEWKKKYYTATNQTEKNVGNTGIYQSLQKNKDNIKIENLEINTKHTDFGVVYYGDQIIYTSSDNGTFKKDWRWNKLPFLDIYSADIDQNMQISNRKQFLKSYKTKYHKGPVTINKAGDFMVFTVNKKVKGKEDLVRLELFYTTKKKDEWKKPKKMRFNNKKYSTAQATLSPDGQILFFASDMPDGEGSVDLYVTFKTGKYSWQEPINLGNKVNTEGKEMFPFYHPDGFLYFASDGRTGLGGLDIFVVKIKDGMPIGEVENLGSPINSSYDDFSFISNEEQMSGFFASNRPEGKGDDDIYKFTMQKPLAKKIISGIAKDNFNNILANTKIELFDESNNLIESITSNEKGEYNFYVSPNKSFSLTGQKEKYKDAKNVVSTNVPEETIESNLVLDLIPELSLLCIVKEKNGGRPVDSINITLINNLSKISEDTLIVSNGNYIKNLPDNNINDEISYNLRVEKEGYVTQEVLYEQKLSENRQYIIEVEMYKQVVGIDLAKMENITIFFDFKKYEITDESAKQLDKMVLLMNNNPTMEIELSSHTDCRGSDSYNETLSDQRAKASASYIQERITNPERIYGKGYGAKKPVNDCDCDIAPCSEDEHQENRRTEFNIIEKK